MVGGYGWGVLVEVLGSLELSNVVLVVLGRTKSIILGEFVGWKLKAWQVHILGLGLSG